MFMLYAEQCNYVLFSFMNANSVMNINMYVLY